MTFQQHRWHKHAGHRRRCITCGAPTVHDARVRYCGKHTRSKGTKINAAAFRSRGTGAGSVEVPHDV